MIYYNFQIEIFELPSASPDKGPIFVIGLQSYTLLRVLSLQ